MLNLLAEQQTSSQLGKAPLLQSLIQLLLGRAVDAPNKTDAKTVRKQLLNSGSLFENRLGKGDTSAFQQDQKGLLLKLQQLLGGNESKQLPQPLGQRITQMTQQAISRVLFNQISSLPQSAQDSSAGADSIRHLAIDIPVLWQGRNENIQMRISGDEDSDASSPDEQQIRWRVQLRFDIATMPPLGADLTLEGQTISVVWFGNSKTRELLEPALSQLKTQLEKIGLDVETLAVREQPPTAINIQPPRNRLIDIKT